MILSFFLSMLPFISASLIQGNVVSGSINNYKELTLSEVDAYNLKAQKNVVSSSDFIKNHASSPNLVSALKAEVQIIPKCMVSVMKSGYAIDQGRSEFCSGHPLSEGGAPSSFDNGAKKMLEVENKKCAFKPCSGVLTQNQQTIATAAHCTSGLGAKDFCDQFVVVFNRQGAKTDFTKDEVFECDGALSKDTTGTDPNFNLHSDNLSQDHAVLHLKKPVPTTTASALALRETPVARGEAVYAVGHPYGLPRKVSTLKASVTKKGAGYNYIQSEGYAYGGNSGGPLIDNQGKLLGILASVDDKKLGPIEKREPRVKIKETGQKCRIQMDNSLTVESIGMDREFKGALESPTLKSEGEIEIGTEQTVETMN